MQIFPVVEKNLSGPTPAGDSMSCCCHLALETAAPTASCQPSTARGTAMPHSSDKDCMEQPGAASNLSADKDDSACALGARAAMEVQRTYSVLWD